MIELLQEKVLFSIRSLIKILIITFARPHLIRLYKCVEKHRQLSKLCMGQASTRLEHILVVDAELASEVGERR